MAGEDDWGRGRGGRTAVAREGRMVEAKWVGQRKKRGTGKDVREVESKEGDALNF